MAIYVDVAGVTKVVATPHVNVAGVWHQADRVFQRRAGVWELVWPAPALVNLTATPVSWEEVDLSWSVSGVLVDHFQVLRDGVVLVPETTAQTFDDAGLLGGTAYTYTVRGYRDGNIAAEATEVVTTPARASLGATAGSVVWDSVTLTWPDPDKGTVDAYRVRRDGTVVGTGVTVQEFTDAERVPGTGYTYLVEALRGGVVVGTDTVDVTTPARSAPTFTAEAVWYDTVNVDWADGEQGSVDTYRLYRGGTHIHTANTGTGFYKDQNLAPTTTYNYSLKAFRGGVEIPPQAADSTTTSGRPTQRKQVTLTPSVTNSYHSQGDNIVRESDAYRTDARLYHGLYDSGWNVNRSKLWFPIPADLRNCVAIHQMLFRVQNQHSYDGTGMTAGWGVHYNGGATPQFGDTTGALGTFWAPKGASSGWLDITGQAERFRTGGAWGLTLEPTSHARSQYGYFAPGAATEMHIDYTIYTG